MLSKYNSFYATHLPPNSHKCSIANKFLIPQNNYLTSNLVKISPSVPSWLVKGLFSIFCGFDWFLKIFLIHIKSRLGLHFRKTIFPVLDTKCALSICFYQAQVFCKKLLIESEEKLDFIGALMCNIKVRLNSAANVVIH